LFEAIEELVSNARFARGHLGGILLWHLRVDKLPSLNLVSSQVVETNICPIVLKPMYIPKAYKMHVKHLFFFVFLINPRLKGAIVEKIFANDECKMMGVPPRRLYYIV